MSALGIAPIGSGSGMLGLFDQIFDDLGNRRSRKEDLGNSGRMQLRDVLLRNDPTRQNSDIACTALVEHRSQLGQQYAMRARENADADPIDVFLDGVGNYVLLGPPQSAVDHFHSGIEQSARDDAGTDVMPVEPDFGD